MSGRGGPITTFHVERAGTSMMVAGLGGLISRLDDVEAGRVAAGAAVDEGATDLITEAPDPLAVWDRCAAAFALRPLQWRDYARCLFASGRIVEALAAYEAYGSNAKTRPKALRALIKCHHALENWPKALEITEAAVADYRGTIHFKTFLLARADQRRRSGMSDDALADFLELTLVNPEDPAGYAGLIGALCDTRNFSAATAVLTDARTHLDDEETLLSMEAAIVQAAGWLPDLLTFCDRLGRLPLADTAILAILKTLFRDRESYLSDEIWQSVSLCFAQRPSLRDAVSIRFATAKVPSAESLLEACTRRLADPALPPHGLAAMKLRAARIRHLVHLGRDDLAREEARAVAGSTAAWPAVPTSISHVLEWLAVREGRLAEAQARYWTRAHRRRGTDRLEELVRWNAVDTDADVVVFMQARNEILNLAPFLAHHRAIGVRRFVIVDNGSTDGTADRLKDEADVELYTTRSSFRRANAGTDWLDPIARDPRHARTLCLRLDADERFLYPHCDRASVSQLWRYMLARGYGAIQGPMVDLFPERLGELAAHDATLASCRYFDTMVERRAVVTPPYWTFQGGVRSRRLAGKKQVLGKIPGIAGGGSVKRLGPHRCSPASVSDVSCALLHYKFRPDFFARARQEVTRREYAQNGMEWQRYLELEAQAADSLLGDGTRLYRSWRDVAKAGLMWSSPAWDRFVDDLGPASAPSPIA